MELFITALFIIASLGTILIAERARNPIAIVHIMFFIVFVDLLHLANLTGENVKHYDLVYYLLAHLSVFLYLVIFSLGLLWLKENHLIPSQGRIFKSAINFGDGWLVAAFCGWFLVKAYLVAKYGVSAFSLFRQLAGQDAVLHFYAWWETPAETYARSFAVGACAIYVIKAISEKGYWKKHWAVSATFFIFVAVYVGTHASIVGPRRFMLLLVLIGLATAAWREGKTVSLYFLTRWRTVLVACLVLFGLMTYYQAIRNNFFAPEIADKLLSGNPIVFAQGIARGMVPMPGRDLMGNEQAKFIREGPFDIVYAVIRRRGDGNPGTRGAITANAFRMIMPRIIAGGKKKDVNADDFLTKQISITPNGPYLVSDVATSLLAIFLADFGFLGILIAPMVMAFSIAVFSYIPRKGLLATPLFILFLFSVLLSLAANVEGDLVAILSIFRNTMILAVALIPFSLMHRGLLKKTKRLSTAIRQRHQDERGVGMLT